MRVNATQLSSGGRLSVDKLAELCLVVALLSLFVPLGLILLTGPILEVFGLSGPDWWPYWALVATVSVVLWLAGLVLSVLSLARAGRSARPKVVRWQALVGLFIEVLLCWVPLIPLVVLSWYLFGYPD